MPGYKGSKITPSIFVPPRSSPHHTHFPEATITGDQNASPVIPRWQRPETELHQMTGIH
jgi:hypothetical protein